MQSTQPESAPQTAFRSPLRYPGGKQKAISQIARFLPGRVKEFREPMVGGGSVFFHARSIDMAERFWINDKFHELACFWKTLKSPKLARKMVDDLLQLREDLDSPAKIKRYYLSAREQVAAGDYQTAMLFFFFNRVTFSGTTRAGGFSAEAAIKRFTVSSIQRLTQASHALSGVTITEGDFDRVIEASGDDVFLFLDPPYFTATKLYGPKGDLHRFDHERLARTLIDSGHKFLITYDDCDEVRALYKSCHLRNWQLRYGMNNCNLEHTSKLGAELFISNYELPVYQRGQG